MAAVKAAAAAARLACEARTAARSAAAADGGGGETGNEIDGDYGGGQVGEIGSERGSQRQQHRQQQHLSGWLVAAALQTAVRLYSGMLWQYSPIQCYAPLFRVPATGTQVHEQTFNCNMRPSSASQLTSYPI